MRFLVDECTGPSVARWLVAQGHDAASIFDESPGLADTQVLQRAVAENRILITNDRDFGELIFREGRSHCGVLFLRLEDERPTSKIQVLQSVLAKHSNELENRFVVVTATEVRFSDA